MSADILEYLKVLDESIKDETLSQMIRQRVDLYNQATYLRNLMSENRISAIYIRLDDPMWKSNNDEFMRILRQQECITRATIDLDNAIEKWISKAPEGIKPLLRTIKIGTGYNG